ncbi:MAG: hypothetical protein K1X72_05960 [Pyrinomonadaceae bacterium]|nr:hypothetical protein [Pyrinomonadaceae bacterium]
MKKLIFIAIAAIGILFVGNTFGQIEEMKLPKNRKAKAGTVKRTNTGSSSRLKRPSPKAFTSIQHEYWRSPKTNNSSKARKQPQKRSTQKRQYKPLSF